MPALITAPRRVGWMAPLGLVVFVVFAAVVFRGRSTAFDTSFFHWAYLHLGAQNSLERRWWLAFSEPALSLLVPLAVVVIAALRRDLRLVTLAVAGPVLALALTESAKPLVGRLIGPGILLGSDVLAQRGSYPSGHETAVVAWLVVVLVALPRWGAPARLRAAAGVVAALWALAAAFGLTINYYHYATDTIGAIGLSGATTVAVALALDTWWPARSRRSGQLT